MHLAGLHRGHHLTLIGEDELLIAGVGGAVALRSESLRRQMADIVSQAAASDGGVSEPVTVADTARLRVILHDGLATVFYTGAHGSVSFTGHRSHLEYNLGVGPIMNFARSRLEQPGPLTGRTLPSERTDDNVTA